MHVANDRIHHNADGFSSKHLRAVLDAEAAVAAHCKDDEQQKKGPAPSRASPTIDPSSLTEIACLTSCSRRSDKEPKPRLPHFAVIINNDKHWSAVDGVGQ